MTIPPPGTPAPASKARISAAEESVVGIAGPDGAVCASQASDAQATAKAVLYTEREDLLCKLCQWIAGRPYSRSQACWLPRVKSAGSVGCVDAGAAAWWERSEAWISLFFTLRFLRVLLLLLPWSLLWSGSGSWWLGLGRWSRCGLLWCAVGVAPRGADALEYLVVQHIDTEVLFLGYQGLASFKLRCLCRGAFGVMDPTLQQILLNTSPQSLQHHFGVY